MVMSDGDKPRDTFLLKRGAYDSPGEKVTPGSSRYSSAAAGQLSEESSRTRPLDGRQIQSTHRSSDRQSLLAVVTSAFGIVKTVDDFGSQGEWPVHPELLDWLATEFMESGWNVKHMQKLIVMSSTYRQSSSVTPALLGGIPITGFSLAVRTFVLALKSSAIRHFLASGLLVEKVGGPSVKPYQPPGLWQELG